MTRLQLYTSMQSSTDLVDNLNKHKVRSKRDKSDENFNTTETTLFFTTTTESSNNPNKNTTPVNSILTDDVILKKHVTLNPNVEGFKNMSKFEQHDFVTKEILTKGSIIRPTPTSKPLQKLEESKAILPIESPIEGRHHSSFEETTSNENSEEYQEQENVQDPFDSIEQDSTMTVKSTDERNLSSFRSEDHPETYVDMEFLAAHDKMRKETNMELNSWNISEYGESNSPLLSGYQENLNNENTANNHRVTTNISSDDSPYCLCPKGYHGRFCSRHNEVRHYPPNKFFGKVFLPFVSRFSNLN